MNSSLKPRTNVVLCVVWAIVVLACFSAASPRPTRLTLITLWVGSVAGLFQTRALRSAPQAFRAAFSLLDVRKVMMASIYGKASIWLLWLNFAGQLIWNWPLRPASYFVFLCGLFSFQLARDLVALPTVFWLSRIRDPLLPDWSRPTGPEA
jgi:hypothetical protein